MSKHRKPTLNTTFLILLVISLFISVYAVLNSRFLRPKAATARVLFSPSSLTLSGSTTGNLSLLIDSGTNQIGFVHTEITFDTTKVRLQSGASITVLGPLGRTVLVTPVSEANTTGRVTLAVGLDPSQRNNPPSGQIPLATLTFVSATSQTNQTTQVSPDATKTKIVGIQTSLHTPQPEPATVSINPSTPASPSPRTSPLPRTTPRASPRATPSARATTYPSPRATPRVSPRASPRATPPPPPPPPPPGGSNLITSGVIYNTDSSANIHRVRTTMVHLPETLLNPTQGWVAVRAKMGFAASDNTLSPDPLMWDMTGIGSNPLFLYYDIASDRFRMASVGAVYSDTQTFALSSYKTIIGTWAAGQVKISIDGAIFKTGSRTGIPITGLFYIGSSVNQGPSPTHRQPNSDYYWVAAGTGTLTDSDAALIHSWGNTDHRQADFPGSPVFLWRAESNAYNDF